MEINYTQPHNVTFAEYLANSSIKAVIGAATVFVPNDPANRDYQAVKSWEAEGNTIAPYVAPPVPFKELQRPAFLFMASKLGLSLADIEGLISQYPDSTEKEQDAKALALIVIQNQQTFRRGSEMLQSLVVLSPLTAEQVDTAWRAAEKIEW